MSSLRRWETRRYRPVGPCNALRFSHRSTRPQYLYYELYSCFHLPVTYYQPRVYQYGERRVLYPINVETNRRMHTPFLDNRRASTRNRYGT